MKSVLLEESCFKLVSRKGNRIYVVLPEGGILASYDLQTTEWKILCMLPECYRAQHILPLHFSADKLYLFSQADAKVFIYDTNFNTYESLVLGRTGYKTASVLEYGDYFILLPFLEERIILFHKITRDINTYSDWKEKLSEELEKMGLQFSFIKGNSACIIKDCLYSLAGCKNQDIIFSICLQDMKLRKIYRINRQGKLFGMEAERESIWIHNKEGEESKLICWNPEKEAIEKETEVLSNINGRLIVLKNAATQMLAGFADGRLLIIDKCPLKVKRCIEDVFPYFDQNGELLIPGFGQSIKMVNLTNRISQEITIPGDIFLGGFLEFIKKEAQNFRCVSESNIGKSIFNSLAAGGLEHGRIV